MNNILKKILLYIGEVVLVTVIWSLLDYFIEGTANIISNLIGVAIIVLIWNIIEGVAKKYKTKKSEKASNN